MKHTVRHFWSYSARVNGALASKLDVHINIGFTIVNIYFSEYTGVGKGRWPGEWSCTVYISSIYLPK